MPELPEVEVTRRALAPLVEGRVVRALTVRDGRLRWPVPADLGERVCGQRVVSLQRRAKYLLWRFSDGTLISHLGMSGSWRVHAGGAPPPGRHDHIDLEFDECLLRLTDPRRFGALVWHPRAPDSSHPLLAHLGIEPFDPDFDGAWVHAGTRGRSASIKQVLMSGDVVVGVGNIYASESLFRARIHPALPARRLGPVRCERLAAAVRSVLGDAIEVGGSTLRDFSAGAGAEGYFTQQAAVYGRDGLPCVACAAPIRRRIQGQRASYFCPRCQRC